MKFFKNHIPIVIPIVGAGSAFLINLFLKSLLTPSDYGEFAALLLVITTLFMIGSMGYEQVLIRLLQVSNGRVIVHKWLLFVAGVVLALTPFISFLLMKVLGVIDNLSAFFIVCSLMIPASTLLSTLFKVSGDLIAHYMFMSAWKLFLFIAVISTTYFSTTGFDYKYLLLSVVAGFLVSLFIANKSNIKVVAGGDVKIILLFLVAGMASIAGYAVFDGMDRFIVKELFSSKVFGDYFFIFTFFMSPVSIVSAYYSAKKLPAYKVNFNILVMRKDYIRVLIISLLIALVFYCLIEGLVWVGLISFSVDYQGIMLGILLLAVIRGGYAILSMAYTVVCSSQTLMLVGLFFGIVSLAIYFVITLLFNSVNIFICVALFTVFWVFRSIIYWFLIGFEAKHYSGVVDCE